MLAYIDNVRGSQMIPPSQHLIIKMIASGNTDQGIARTNLITLVRPPLRRILYDRPETTGKRKQQA